MSHDRTLRKLLTVWATTGVLILGGGLLGLVPETAGARSRGCVVYYYKVSGVLSFDAHGQFDDGNGDTAQASASETETFGSSLSRLQYAIYIGAPCKPRWQMKLQGTKENVAWTASWSDGYGTSMCSGSAPQGGNIKANAQTNQTSATLEMLTGEHVGYPVISCSTSMSEIANGALGFPGLLEWGPEVNIAFPPNPARSITFNVQAPASKADASGASYTATVTAKMQLTRLRDKCIPRIAVASCGVPPS